MRGSNMIFFVVEDRTRERVDLDAQHLSRLLQISMTLATVCVILHHINCYRWLIPTNTGADSSATAAIFLSSISTRHHDPATGTPSWKA